MVKSFLLKPASHCFHRTCSTFLKSRLHENIEISAKYLARMAKMGMTLEIELGVTGGEEDGVDNSAMWTAHAYIPSPKM